MKTAYAETFLRSSSVANDLKSYRPSGIKVSKSFIHSVYRSSVRISTRGSACAEKVASGRHHSLQTAQPFPASHASKKLLAIAVIDDIFFHPLLFGVALAAHIPLLSRDLKIAI